jgi:hypothetical protein
VAARELPQGPVFACALSPDDALTLAVGGQLGGLRTYDIGEVRAVFVFCDGLLGWFFSANSFLWLRRSLP